jgi:hypothetical protein
MKQLACTPELDNFRGFGHSDVTGDRQIKEALDKMGEMQARGPL